MVIKLEITSHYYTTFLHVDGTATVAVNLQTYRHDFQGCGKPKRCRNEWQGKQNAFAKFKIKT